VHHGGVRRRLVLLRHGESGWDGDPPSDHDRVLTDRGHAEAAATGTKLRQADWTPQQVVCSTARRARQTAEIAANGAATSHHQSLYLGGLTPLAEVLGDFSDSVETVWAVGHNPSFSAVASALGGNIVSLSTAHAACLEVAADSWEEAMTMVGAWHLIEVLTPR
jgi:phosphohistidine phosphatase